MWKHQVAHFAENWQVLTYDMHGHGRSQVSKGAYSFPALARDVIGLLDFLKIDRVHWVGLSIGGMIGMELGLRHAGRLHSLTLANTKAGDREGYTVERDARIELVEREGMAPLVEPTIARWFSEDFIREHPEEVDPVREMIATTPPHGMIGCCHALNTLAYGDTISAIDRPALVIAGGADESTTVEDAEFIRDCIPGAELAVLEGCKHLSNIEDPAGFNAALQRHLDRLD
jgi:3-oxoadipate enol-lactonase